MSFLRVRFLRLAIAVALIDCALLGFCWWLTEMTAWRHPGMSFSTLFLVRGSALAAAAVLLLGFAWLVLASRRPSIRIKRATLVVLGVLLPLLGAEGLFMFVPRSHDVGYTLGSMLWFRYHWRPLNSLGYRDVEHVAEPGKHLVFALGDSFTAGHGVERVEWRYSNRLASRRPDLQVLNLGRNGSDTLDELLRLRTHPLHPEVVILQYTPNDIEGAAVALGGDLPTFQPYRDLEEPLLHIVRDSFLLDYFYWLHHHSDADEYMRALRMALVDEAVVSRHLRDVQGFEEYAQGEHCRLVVVVFPFLQDLELGRATRRRVIERFRADGYAVIDVEELVRDLDPDERVVNATDGHPSARVHALVAEALVPIVSTE